VGHREAERALQLGLLYTPEEALKIKLVDEIAEPATLMLRAEEEMQKWCKIPGIIHLIKIDLLLIVSFKRDHLLKKLSDGKRAYKIVHEARGNVKFNSAKRVGYTRVCRFRFKRICTKIFESIFGRIKKTKEGLNSFCFK